MWAQLAMAGLKSVQDNQANKQNLASNVITQKYSPWTGQRADFSAQGKNSAVSNLIAGYGSGMLQDKLDAKDAAETAAKANNLPSAVANRDDADYYAKLSADPSSVGVSPIKQQSSFASSPIAPARAPAAAEAPATFGSMFNQQPQNQSPLMLQGRNPQQQQNPWLTMSRGY